MKKDNSIRPFFCLDTKVVHVPRRDATADEKAARDRHFYIKHTRLNKAGVPVAEHLAFSREASH